MTTSRLRFPLLVLAVGLLGLLRYLCAPVAARNEHGSKPLPWVEQMLKRLTLEEKIGQMLQIRCYVDSSGGDSPDYSATRLLIRKYHIGSILLGMHVTISGPIRNSPLDVVKTANMLQADSELPLLIAADLERGLSSRMVDVPSFPWPMAFGAIANKDEVEKFAAITAKEARSVGIQWALAPVADVNSNPSNPVINDRSFGENPSEVSALVAAFIKGARQNGLLVTAKHFPGLGDTSVDSHRQIATVDGNLRHLEDIEFRPFRSAIDAGVDSIMLAHARVLAIDQDSNRIATVSSKVVTDVLRGQLGFKGVVLTDALEMKGITGLYQAQNGSPTALAAVDAIRAGCDVLMVPTDLDGAFNAITNAVRGGLISPSRIDDSVRRILKMKASVGLDKDKYANVDRVTALTANSDDMAFAQHIADNAVTLVRSNGETLPLIASGLPIQPRKPLVAILLAEAFENSNGHEFERNLRARRPDARIYYIDNKTARAGGIEVLNSLVDAGEVVVVAYLMHQGARQLSADGLTKTIYGLKGPSGQFLQQILAVARETVVVALGSPYLIENFPQIHNYICAYAMASTSEISVVKALFGEIQNTARLPVTLPDVAPRGFSVAWPSGAATQSTR
jgi:beta-N-acetylhexosaminidase